MLTRLLDPGHGYILHIDLYAESPCSWLHPFIFNILLAVLAGLLSISVHGFHLGTDSSDMCQHLDQTIPVLSLSSSRTLRASWNQHC